MAKQFSTYSNSAKMEKNNSYPLFSHWFVTLEWLLDMSERLPKSLRFSLAQRMVQHSLDISELITQAIYSKERRAFLEAINLKIELLRMLMRLCHRKKHLSDKQYRFISQRLDEAGRMTGGWLKSS